MYKYECIVALMSLLITFLQGLFIRTAELVVAIQEVRNILTGLKVSAQRATLYACGACVKYYQYVNP